MKYTLLAVMSDKTHSWTVIVGHFDTELSAKEEATRYEARYNEKSCRCEWTQIFDGYITREDLGRKEAHG